MKKTDQVRLGLEDLYIIWNALIIYKDDEKRYDGYTDNQITLLINKIDSEIVRRRN